MPSTSLTDYSSFLDHDPLSHLQRCLVEVQKTVAEVRLEHENTRSTLEDNIDSLDRRVDHLSQTVRKIGTDEAGCNHSTRASLKLMHGLHLQSITSDRLCDVEQKFHDMLFQSHSSVKDLLQQVNHLRTELREFLRPLLHRV